jgi:hypothetical protein
MSAVRSKLTSSSSTCGLTLPPTCFNHFATSRGEFQGQEKAQAPHTPLSAHESWRALLLQFQVVRSGSRKLKASTNDNVLVLLINYCTELKFFQYIVISGIE